jgi:spermidine dehydrogenase
MKESERKLGMGCDITRRDFIHDVSLAALGLSLPGLSLAVAPTAAGGLYPPILTGLRGSQPGSFEAAHALAPEGRRFADPQNLDEHYDLVVVGGGLSGLAAAHFHRKLHGPDARILVLDNHDDFGGNARRNEFHQGGPLRLAWGGTVNIEYPLYSDVARGVLDDLGIDIPRLLKDFSFSWGDDDLTGLQAATWFDAATYGRDLLLPGVRFSNVDPARLAERVDELPISEPGRAALRAFLLSTTDVLADLAADQKEAYLRRTSYADFLRQWFAMPDDAIQLFRRAPSGYWGLPAEKLSVAECLETGLPGSHVLGGFGYHEPDQRHSPVAMFPDGNSSIARLLVRALVPAAFPEMAADADPFDIVTARLDYGQLDQPGTAARIRLNATAVKTENRTQDETVAVSYVEDGNLYRVTARSSVLACNNRIIPWLCPELPQTQKTALAQCIRRPLLVTNVLLRNGQALQRTGIRSAYLPGSMLGNINLVTGVNVGPYRPPWRPQDPCVLQFYASWIAPGSEQLGIVQQHQAARAQMLAMPFEDFEREVRSVLSGMLGSGGFDAAEDILAITVNRWPHGYARDHVDLEDPAWNADPPPNVVGRARCGNIAIANSDAGADAFTHTAFDEAWRAVSELAGGDDV